ncbi:MAG: hypothetical protein QXD88_01075 [Candidatus Anstonellales archaeon]
MMQEFLETLKEFSNRIAQYKISEVDRDLASLGVSVDWDRFRRESDYYNTKPDLADLVSSLRRLLERRSHINRGLVKINDLIFISNNNTNYLLAPQSENSVDILYRLADLYYRAKLLNIMILPDRIESTTGEFVLPITDNSHFNRALSYLSGLQLGLDGEFIMKNRINLTYDGELVICINNYRYGYYMQSKYSGNIIYSGSNVIEYGNNIMIPIYLANTELKHIRDWLLENRFSIWIDGRRIVFSINGQNYTFPTDYDQQGVVYSVYREYKSIRTGIWKGIVYRMADDEDIATIQYLGAKLLYLGNNLHANIKVKFRLDDELQLWIESNRGGYVLDVAGNFERIESNIKTFLKKYLEDLNNREI